MACWNRGISGNGYVRAAGWRENAGRQEECGGNAVSVCARPSWTADPSATGAAAGAAVHPGIGQRAGHLHLRVRPGLGLRQSLQYGNGRLRRQAFSTTDLAARIQAALRRQAVPVHDAPAEPYLLGDLTVDYAASTFLRLRSRSEIVRLTGVPDRGMGSLRLVVRTR